MQKNDQAALSIIVPTLNEAGNIKPLVERITRPLSRANIPHEVLFIDDHSTDTTVSEVGELQAAYPSIRIVQKVGKPGKAYSLIEGFDLAAYQLVCMIDADLQYPPEAIVPMYEKLARENADIVITERIEEKTNWLRRLTSSGFNLVFTRLLFGINYDSQSGLKLFKKKILQDVQVSPSPWSFDLEFLVRSLENHYKIISHKIQFAERVNGESKLHTFSTAIELAKASIQLRRTTSIERVKQGYQISGAMPSISRQPLRVVLPFVFAIALATGATAHAQALSLSTTIDTKLPFVQSLLTGNSTTKSQPKAKTAAPSTASLTGAINNLPPINNNTGISKPGSAKSSTTSTTNTSTSKSSTTKTTNPSSSSNSTSNAPTNNASTSASAPQSYQTTAEKSSANGNANAGQATLYKNGSQTDTNKNPYATLAASNNINGHPWVEGAFAALILGTLLLIVAVRIQFSKRKSGIVAYR